MTGTTPPGRRAGKPKGRRGARDTPGLWPETQRLQQDAQDLPAGRQAGVQDKLGPSPTARLPFPGSRRGRHESRRKTGTGTPFYACPVFRLDAGKWDTGTPHCVRDCQSPFSPRRARASERLAAVNPIQRGILAHRHSDCIEQQNQPLNLPDCLSLLSAGRNLRLRTPLRWGDSRCRGLCPASGLLGRMVLRRRRRRSQEAPGR